MTPQELSDRIAGVALEVAGWVVDPADRGRDDLDGSVEVWDRLDRLMTDLSIVRREHAVMLARRLDDERTLVTRDGPVTVHRDIPKVERWDGAKVLTELGVELIDAGSGEVIEAVPLEVLRAILPAVGEGQTSSKWKISGLRQAIPKPERFRHVEYGTAYIARGPLQVRNTRPPADEPPAPQAYPQEHV